MPSFTRSSGRIAETERERSSRPDAISARTASRWRLVCPRWPRELNGVGAEPSDAPDPDALARTERSSIGQGRERRGHGVARDRSELEGNSVREAGHGIPRHPNELGPGAVVVDAHHLGIPAVLE